MLSASPKADSCLRLTLSAFSLSLRPYLVPSVYPRLKSHFSPDANKLDPLSWHHTLFQSSVYASHLHLSLPQTLLLPPTGGKQHSHSLSWPPYWWLQDTCLAPGLLHWWVKNVQAILVFLTSTSRSPPAPGDSLISWLSCLGCKPGPKPFYFFLFPPFA